MVDLLYRWPAAAKFGSRVPKEKFYGQGAVTSAMREKFVSEVQRLTWAFKLAESTINLPGNAAVPEIQVFHIDAKADEVTNQVLSAIDKAIQYPVIFEIMRKAAGKTQVRMVATYKLLGAGVPKLSSYYSTSWLSADLERNSLPTAIDLPTLYAAILNPLMPVTVRLGEEMSVVAERLAAVGKLEREITTLERKLRTEPQFNRRIELRRSLKTRQQQLEKQR